MNDQHHTLILGSGGREHALAHLLAQSEYVGNLYIAPGNGGTLNRATNLPDVSANSINQVAEAIEKYEIELLVVGPEDPLVNGLRDELEVRFPNLAIVGPSKEGAQLEGSKDFAKQFMARHKIPTAAYKTFTKASDAQAYIEQIDGPYVLKADGLAAGKGVLIIDDVEEAKAAAKDMLEGGKFGEAGHRLVIEAFLDGIEFSVFAAVDGKSYVLLPTAKDYKRIGEGDTGLNTGGMGAVSPPPFVDDVLMHNVEEQIVKPTVKGLQEENIDYRGFVFFGLINVGGDPYVIEYNCRLGDPETEVVLPRIKSDFGALCNAIHHQTLHNYTIEIRPESAATVMVVSGGYPEAYERGKEISGLNQVHDDIMIFHAGTARDGNKLLTNGGRVMAFTAIDDHYQRALLHAYNAIDKVCFEGIYYRKDIGFDLP
jgi:phosphoribosylamine--glycine ligase